MTVQPERPQASSTPLRAAQTSVSKKHSAALKEKQRLSSELRRVKKELKGAKTEKLQRKLERQKKEKSRKISEKNKQRDKKKISEERKEQVVRFLCRDVSSRQKDTVTVNICDLIRHALCVMFSINTTTQIKTFRSTTNRCELFPP